MRGPAFDAGWDCQAGVESDLAEESVGVVDLPVEVGDVVWVDSLDSYLFDDGQKVVEGSDGCEWCSAGVSKDTPRGSERESCLDEAEWSLL